MFLIFPKDMVELRQKCVFVLLCLRQKISGESLGRQGFCSSYMNTKYSREMLPVARPL